MLSFLEIDRDNDLAYVVLQPGLRGRRGVVARSIRAAEDIVIDFDEKDQVIGIELLRASSRLNVQDVKEGPSNLIVGVKEAAEMLGVEKPNFIRDYANKLDFPEPIAELASGRLWLRQAIDRYLKSKSKKFVRKSILDESQTPRKPNLVAIKRIEDGQNLPLFSAVERSELPRPALALVKREKSHLVDEAISAKARAISPTKKRRFLLGIGEEQFRDDLVRPLFLRQGLRDGRTLCGFSDRGVDAVFIATNQLGMDEIYFVEARKGSFSLANSTSAAIDQTISTLRKALDTEIVPASTRRKQPYSKVIVCVSGKINDNAKNYIGKQIKDPRVVFLDADDLVPLIDERFPEFWLGIDVKIPPYLRLIKQSVEGASEDLLVAPSASGVSQAGAATDQMFVELRLYRTVFRQVRRKGRVEREPRFDELPIRAVLNRRDRRVLILGEAGSGKSTCLKRLAYVLATRGLESEGNIAVPILLRASDVAVRAASSSLVEIASEQTMRITKTTAASFSAIDLQEGRVVILIDALDELADDSVRREVVDLINEFHEHYPACQVISSSREYAFVKTIEELRGFERYRLSPINYRQAELILRRLQSAQSLPEETSKEILRRIEQVHGMELNPLLVTVFAATSEYSRQDIPANITELFKKFTEMMLGRWDSTKGLGQQYHAPLKDFVLTKVAFEMHRREVTALDIDEFRSILETELLTRGHKADVPQLLNEILDRSGLFRIVGDAIEFRHLLLQEFFAGRGIPSVEFLQAVISNEWWQRAIVFYFGDNPSTGKGLEAIIRSVALRTPPELYRSAVTLGLALQACYLVEVKDKVAILQWVIDGLSTTKADFISLSSGEEGRPLFKFLAYYLFGRDSVACNILEERHEEIIRSLTSPEMNQEERDTRVFWVIVGLIESGALETAERLIRSFRPTDGKLLLAVEIGCFLIQHLRVANKEQRKVAERISGSLAERVLPFKRQLLDEFRGQLLEVRQGEIRAIDAEVEDHAVERGVTV